MSLNLESAQQLIPEVMDALPEQNRKGSETVAFINLTSQSAGLMNRNHYPLPGHEVIYFGGCRSEREVRERIIEHFEN